MNWQGRIVRGWGWIRNQDLVVLLLTLVLAAGTWGMVELVDEVFEGETREVDERLIMAMRSADDPGDPLGPGWFEEGMRDLTALGSMAVLLLLSATVAGFLGLRGQWHSVWLLVGSLAGGLGLTLLLKDYFGRPRPELVPHLHDVITASFPSGHALLAAVFYLTLGALLARFVVERRVKIYMVGVGVGITGVVGVSRVYMGVHYPTDVLAGWTLGLMWAVACWLVARQLQRTGAVEKPEEQTEETPSGRN